MDPTNSTEIKDSFMEMEKSLAAKEALERSRKIKIILIPSIIILLIILIIILLVTLKPKNEEKKDQEKKEEKFNGIIKAGYIINNPGEKIKLINKWNDELNISIYINNTKIKELKLNDTELEFNNIYDKNIEIKYEGIFTNMSYLFYEIKNLEKVNLTNNNISQVKTMEKMFYGCSSLKYAEMNLLNTSNIENINSMFENCENIELINMKNFDTKNIITSKSMFENCKNLSKINIDYFDLTRITDASYMFAKCNSLKEITLKNDGKESSNINIKSIFSGDYALERVNLNNFDKKIITAIDYAFNDCKELRSIDLSKFDTSKVTSIYSLFSNCYKLTSINISSFDLSNTDSFSYAFRNCISLKSIDLSNFNTNKAKTMAGLFYGCSSLISIELINYIIDITSLADLFNKCNSLQNVTINVKRVVDVSRMFNGCTSLKYLDLSNFNSNEIKLRTDFFPSQIKELTVIYNSTLFEKIKNFIPNDDVKFIDIEGYNGSIEAKYKINEINKKIKIINKPWDDLNISIFVNNTKIYELKENETEINFDNIPEGKIKLKYSGILTNLNSLFKDIIYLEEIILNEIDINKVKSMEKMFYGCTSLKTVSMNLLKITNIENINSMFENCEIIESIYMKKFDMKNVITAKSAFENCKNLKKIDLDYFDLTRITDASYMFAKCNSLKEITLKNDGKESSNINIKSIFSGDYALERVNLNNFDKKIITAIDYAFNDCKELRSIDLSKFDTSKVTSIYSLFSNCYKLTSINISSFDLSNTDSFSYAFRNCTSLKSIDLSNFNTNNAKTMSGLFYGCSSLISIEFINYIIDITSLDDLFNQCNSLQNITINIKRVQSVSRMFKGCYSLKYLDFSKFNGNEIKLRTDFFPENVTNVSVVYNSSIFDKIKNFIPNEGIDFIDINDNLKYIKLRD